LVGAFGRKEGEEIPLNVSLFQLTWQRLLHMLLLNKVQEELSLSDYRDYFEMVQAQHVASTS